MKYSLSQIVGRFGISMCIFVMRLQFGTEGVEVKLCVVVSQKVNKIKM